MSRLKARLNRLSPCGKSEKCGEDSGASSARTLPSSHLCFWPLRSGRLLAYPRCLSTFSTLKRFGRLDLCYRPPTSCGILFRRSQLVGGCRKRAKLTSPHPMPAAPFGPLSPWVSSLWPWATPSTMAALRRTHATYVNLIATQEVTGGIILSYLFLGEVPSFNSLLGAAITLTGIATVLI